MPDRRPTLTLKMALASGFLIAVLTTTVSAQPTAEYTVRFDATWSAESHPIGFPPSPHFSGLIGGTHNDQVVFWEVGSLASPGIENMAETGSKSPLDDEVQAAIDAGTAGVIISGGGINSSPGSVSVSFSIEESHPLVTLVSMLAPSPDWFVGVSGVSLWEEGDWVGEKVIDLMVFDAGTDSGVNYTSPNFPTIPPVSIFEKNDGPFIENNIVGSFTFTRITTDVAEASMESGIRLESTGPNPMRESTRFRFQAPSGTTVDLRVYDVRGRMVRTLFLDRSARATGQIDWDGRTDEGIRVSAGTYYLSLRAGSIVRNERVVVVR